MPLSGSSAQWDSLTGNICELVSNVASANEEAQRAFTQGGALRSLIELVPILTSARAMTVAQGQPSLTFATEQVLLAAATLVWCTGASQSLLLEAGTIGACLRAIDQCATRLFGSIAPPPDDGTLVGSTATMATTASVACAPSTSAASPTAAPPPSTAPGSGGSTTTSSSSTTTAAANGTGGSPPGPAQVKEYDATHDVVVYQACLLLTLNTQLENKPMREGILKNALSMARRSGNGRAHAELSALCSLHINMFEATEHIRLNHHHSDEVVKALQLLTRSVASKEEAPYLLVHMHGTQTLELMLRCLSNIDEEVLYHACLALYALIQRSPPARILFLRKQGIAELAECLRDYNTDVKATSLRILCLLAAESDHAREEMRTEEVLLAILRTVQSYPAEDVTLPVLDAALEAIAHIVLSSRTNQDYIRSVSGLEPLAAALHHCVSHLPEHLPEPQSPQIGADGGAQGGLGGSLDGRQYMTSAAGRRGRGSGTRVEPAATCGAPSAVTAAQSRPTTPGAGFSRPATASRVRDNAYDNPRRSSGDALGQNGAQYGENGSQYGGSSYPAAERPSLDLWKVTETACDALNNVAYRNADNQAALLELGVLPACLTLLNRHVAASIESVSGVHAGALNLLINMADTNRDSQDALGSADAAAAVHRLLCSRGSPKLMCSACLLLSHVTWNHHPNQHLYGTEPAIRTLLSLLSPAGRAAVIDGAAVAGGAMMSAEEASGHATELTLYSMMALVNLTYCNERVQESVRACGGVPLIQQQLSSPLYEARKTAAFCLGNLVRDNTSNARETVVSGGVEALLRCLNDEDDDELSKTAYSTILHLGAAGLQQLLALIDAATRTICGPPNKSPAGVKSGAWSMNGGSSANGGPKIGSSSHSEKLVVEDEDLFEEELNLDAEPNNRVNQRPSNALQRPSSAITGGGGSLFQSRSAEERFVSSPGGSLSAPSTRPAPQLNKPEPAKESSLKPEPAAAVEKAAVPPEVAAETATAMLERALPVLNGMVYTAEAHQVRAHAYTYTYIHTRTPHASCGSPTLSSSSF